MSKTSRPFHQTYEPVSPVDIVDDRRRSRGGVGFALPEDQKEPSAVSRSRTSSSSSSLKTPRAARFAEATSVNSPIDAARSPFADPPEMSKQHAKPSDVGFGYIANNDDSAMPVEQTATYHGNAGGGPMSPLKSALKTPGTSRGFDALRSPTFKEEQVLEKHEDLTEKEQKKDLRAKTRVRMAKMVLRGTNFACSLIVLSMISTTFSIFNATKAIPPRNNLPPWAEGTNPWPQITLLVISCISLGFSLFIFYAYYRGGHKRAEKTAVYYTVFAVFFFAFSIVMWAIGAGILHGSKAHGKGQDIWGWSCKDNRRKQLFQQDVSYSLICRLQNWSLVCALIEIIVETVTIAIYAIVFYRFYSKRRLHKSMDLRDKARSDLYLAQLRTQSAPNTPGFAQTPRSPAFPMGSVGGQLDSYSAAENGEYYRNFASPTERETLDNTLANSTPFTLQAPPIRVQHATPKAAQDGFEIAPAPTVPQVPAEDRFNEHVAAAPGEQTYDAVPIPGAYASPLSSPSFAPQQYQQHGSMAGQLHGEAPGQAF